MSFSELFDSEFKNRNKGHFSAIARVALADGDISNEEQLFLDRLSRNLEISPEEYADIIENPSKYVINPPYLQDQRIERLYDLARMVKIETHLDETKEDILLRKFAIALGFEDETIDKTVVKALQLATDKVDIEDFMDGMKK